MRSLLAALLTVVAVAATDVPAVTTIANVGFISCNKHDRSQAYWPVIARHLRCRCPVPMGEPACPAACQPRDAHAPIDGLIWLGDIIYGDRSPFPSHWISLPVTEMAAKWRAQRQHREYADFLADTAAVAVAAAPGTAAAEAARRDLPARHVAGVWDDHDMGKNDGGGEYGDKAAVLQLMLDFLDVPASAARRSRHGAYSFHAFPFRGSNPQSDGDGDAQPAAVAAEVRRLRESYDFAVCAVLLDVRWFRSPLINTSGDMLGEAQWAWLRDVLAGAADGPDGDVGVWLRALGPSDARLAPRRLSDRCLVTAIGTGVQFLSDEKPTEHWAHFAHERQRMLRLLRDTGTERFLFLSGDVHMGEIQRLAPATDPACVAVAAAAKASGERGEAAAATGEAAVAASGCGPLGVPVVDVTSSGLTHCIGDIAILRWVFEWLFPHGPPRRAGYYLLKNFGSLAVAVTPRPSADGLGGDAVAVELLATVHAVENGRPVLRERLDLFRDLALPPADPAVTACPNDCRVAPIPSGVRWLAMTLRDNFFPWLVVHQIIIGFLIAAGALGFAVAVALLWLCVRVARCCRGQKRKKD